MKNTYKPLPDSLTIKQSGINGLGLFAKEGIGQGTNLGTTHRKLKGEIWADLTSPYTHFGNHEFRGRMTSDINIKNDD